MLRLLCLVLLLLPSTVHAENLARAFAGGVTGDNILLAASYTPSSTWSVCWWGNVTAYDATARKVFEWRKTDGTLPNNSAVYITSGSNVVQFSHTFDTTGGIWNITGPSTGSAHSVCITYDQSNVANNPVIYLNGSSVAVTQAAAPVGTAAANTTNIRLGNHATGSGNAINGSVGGFALWLNVILSAAEVSSYHAKAPACAIQPSKLAVYLPMDLGQSPEPDRSTGATTGTVTSATTTTGFSLLNPQCRSLASAGAGR